MFYGMFVPTWAVVAYFVIGAVAAALAHGISFGFWQSENRNMARFTVRRDFIYALLNAAVTLATGGFYLLIVIFLSGYARRGLMFRRPA